MKMETKDYLKELAISRTKVARFKAEVKDAEKELEASEVGIKFTEAKERLQLQEAAQKGLETGIKARTQEEFIKTGRKNKKPHDGVQLKEFTVVRILDENAAKEWAATNAPNTVSIKTSKFNQVAKALGSLKFVEIYNEWRAQIASDLSMYEELENE